MEDNEAEKRYSRTEALAEAMLFAAGDAVSEEDLSIVLRITKKETAAVMERLAGRYTARGSGIVLRRVEDGYQLSSRPDLHEDLRSYFETAWNAPLSRAALEALTIVAYNQPITRGGVEMIRGVNSDGVLAKLLERGLICEKGRSESPGRPVLYGTTSLFLKSVGLSSLEELARFAPEPAATPEPEGSPEVSP